MPSLYIVAAQPNPPGKDVSYGTAANDQLNREWIEFTALEDRSLAGDVLSHVTFDRYCNQTGSDQLIRFGPGTLNKGRRLRVHTGRGSNHWEGSTYHWYLNRPWYVWNNACGDRATLTYEGRVIDSAFYRSNPPEGVLVRQQGTDELVPARNRSYSWR